MFVDWKKIWFLQEIYLLIRVQSFNIAKSIYFSFELVISTYVDS